MMLFPQMEQKKKDRSFFDQLEQSNAWYEDICRPELDLVRDFVQDPLQREKQENFPVNGTFLGVCIDDDPVDVSLPGVQYLDELFNCVLIRGREPGIQAIDKA